MYDKDGYKIKFHFSNFIAKLERCVFFLQLILAPVVFKWRTNRPNLPNRRCKPNGVPTDRVGRMVEKHMLDCVVYYASSRSPVEAFGASPMLWRYALETIILSYYLPLKFIIIFISLCYNYCGN